jgi:hypothetical protein
MAGKYDDLLKELDHDADKNPDEIARRKSANAAAAIRELQAHVPPPGWRATNYIKPGPEGHDVSSYRTENGVEWRWRKGWGTSCIRSEETYPTAAAAMAAIEEAGND